MAKQPELGDIIEAYCEKCRLNLDVSVAAVVGGEIKQVQCRTCSNFVPYKEPIPDSVRKERVFKRVLSIRDRKSQRRGDSGPTVQRRGAGRTPATFEPPPPHLAGAETPPPPPRRPEQTKRWREVTDQVDSRSALPYTPQRSFREGEYLLHKQFGMGYVEKVEGDEIVVLFRDGEESLPINQDREYE